MMYPTSLGCPLNLGHSGAIYAVSASGDRFAPFYRNHRALPRVALPAPEPRLEIDKPLLGYHPSVPEHIGLDEHNMPTDAFELHEITWPEIGQPGVVERLHARSAFAIRPQKENRFAPASSIAESDLSTRPPGTEHRSAEEAAVPLIAPFFL